MIWRNSGAARRGSPMPKGGSGAYSIASSTAWAISGPATCSQIRKPRSIPAVTPAEVQYFPSTVTRSPVYVGVVT